MMVSEQICTDSSSRDQCWWDQWITANYIKMVQKWNVVIGVQNYKYTKTNKLYSVKYELQSNKTTI